MVRRSFTDQPLPHQLAPREALTPAERGYAGFGPYRATTGERVAFVWALVIAGIAALVLAVHFFSSK